MAFIDHILQALLWMGKRERRTDHSNHKELFRNHSKDQYFQNAEKLDILVSWIMAFTMFRSCIFHRRYFT
jgi:hypothetical protein